MTDNPRNPFATPARIAEARADLLSSSERADLEAQFGQMIGPILDAKLEAKAVELVARRTAAVVATYALLGDGPARDTYLVDRERAAEMLGVSLSTIKRMEATGELPEPIKYGERIVRHRLVDIEALAKTRMRP